ncbi:MAG: HAMP domain-containing sensor histidine kinase [Halieaceae bacterium]
MYTLSMTTDRGIYRASMRALRQLLLLRIVVVVGQLFVLLYLAQQGLAEFSRNGMLLTLVVLGLLTLFSFLRSLFPWQVSEPEYFSQLCLDLAGLSALFYFSGGTDNPFITFYLVPVVLGAVLLPRGYSWSLAGLAALAYFLLLNRSIVLPPSLLATQTDIAGMSVRALGLWINFLVSVALLAYLPGAILKALRESATAGNAPQTNGMHEDQIRAVAGLAASTAKELGAPLATMAAIMNELQTSSANAGQNENYQLLAEQIEHCLKNLDKLSRTARLTEVGETHWVDIVDYCNVLVDQWLVQRPEATADVQESGDDEPPRLEIDFAFGQALENLLDNAANAWPTDIAVAVSWDAREIVISITDRGPGVSAELVERMQSSLLQGDGDGDGLHIGLLSSQATAFRYGGRIDLERLSEGGTRASLVIPRQDL